MVANGGKPPLLGNGIDYTLLVDGRDGVVEPFVIKKIEIVAKVKAWDELVWALCGVFLNCGLL